ncbi:hypothetical protein M758_6G013800 [Ceratodon purpureus]|nr:hypothetical protein M758_6G013800 [Ceratodon purpureus]
MSTVMEMGVVTNPVERQFRIIRTFRIRHHRCSDVNWLQLERQKSVNSINFILVGSTVVATVTYTFLMQPPYMASLPAQENSLTGGGPVPWVDQPEHAIAFYIIVTSLSFTVSVLSLIVGINGLIISSKTLKKEVELLRKSVRWASRLMFIAIFCLLLAMFVGAMSTFHVMVPHRHIVTQILAGFTMVFMPLFTMLVIILSLKNPSWVNPCSIVEQLRRLKTVMKNLVAS